MQNAARRRFLGIAPLNAAHDLGATHATYITGSVEVAHCIVGDVTLDGLRGTVRCQNIQNLTSTSRRTTCTPGACS